MPDWGEDVQVWRKQESELSDVWSEDSLDKWNIKGKALGWEPPDSERLRKGTEATVAEAEREQGRE